MVNGFVPRALAGLVVACSAVVLPAGLSEVTTTASPPGRAASVAASEPGCVTEPEGAAGQLKFSTAALSVSENAPERVLLVLRVGGSAGPASVTVRTADVTATAGMDYGAVDTTVAFADGDATVRLLRVPVVPDSVHEENETLSVTLTDPVCATLGVNTSVVLTITNDDTATTFALGGTISGLVGTGLVLRTQSFEEISPVNDGAFVFTRGVLPGSGYEVSVVTQPSNPIQNCTLAHGVGVMPEANVLDVAVVCETATSHPHLDPTFGTGGFVTTSGVRGAQAVAVQPDGRIVTAGDNSLARYLPDGSPDLGFGADGAVVTGLDAAFLGDAIDVALQADGSIVVVGVIDNRSSTREDFAVQRYDEHGVPDGGFGTGGTVTTDFNGGFDRAYAVAVQSDGAIVVAGHAAGPGGVGNDFALARYTPAGALDTTFDGDGRVLTNIAGSSDLGHALALQPDGRAVVAGRVSGSGRPIESFGVARYTTEGAPDPSFNGSGAVIVDFGRGSIAKGVTLDAEGRIVVVGNAPSASLVGGTDFAVARLTASGTLDASFDTDGLLTTDYGVLDALPHNDFASDVLVQPDGTVLVVGTTQFPGSADVAVARYTSAGILDATFGDAGLITVDFHDGFDAGTDLARQAADGRIIVAGSAINGFTMENAVMRLLP